MQQLWTKSSWILWLKKLQGVNRKTLICFFVKTIAKSIEGKTKQEAAFIVGQTVAKNAMSKGIKTVVFDRAGYQYTGRVKAVADGARDAGLEF